MWIRGCFSLILLGFLYVEVTVAQATVSTTQWEFQQILGSLIDRENRVRSQIDKLAPLVNATLAEIRAKGAGSNLEKCLDDLRDSLVWLRTLDSYVKDNTSWTCTEISVRAAGIQFDIQRANQIYVEVLKNVTLLYQRLSCLNVAFTVAVVTNALTDTQRNSVQAVITSLNILIDEYNQYGLTLLTAIYKYTRLYVELLFIKKNLCVCPTALSKESSESLRIVDASINQIQKYVNEWERQIREMSATTIKNINSINPELKLNPGYLLLTQTLDNIVTLLTGYLLLNTYDNVNVTLNCDEAAMKIAFIEYKMEQYFQYNIECVKNASFVLREIGLCSTYIAVNSQTLKENQKQGLATVIKSLQNLVDEFTNYSLSLATGWVKLLELFLNAKNARYGSCNCTGDVVTTLAPAPGTTPTPTTTLLITSTTTQTTPTTTTPTTTTTTTPAPTTTIPLATTTPLVETTMPETPAPDTTTLAPETTVPETTFSEVTRTPETTVPATTVPETTTIVETTPIQSGPKCVADDEFPVSLRSITGGYIKTACFVLTAYTQPDADARCKADKMVLFQIDTAETQSALFEWLEPNIAGANMVFRIDGLREETGDNKWHYNSYGNKLAFSGLDWLINEDTLTGLNSLTVGNMAFPMSKVMQTVKVDGLEPTYLFPVICEFMEE